MENYTLIVGENPSKGARSPILWNKTYSELNINQKMYPKDIAKNDFDLEIPKLFSDKAFVGGAVAVPYKEKIIKFTSNKEQILQGPKAVNCLVRDKDRLLGYNTDGIATIKILEKQLNLGKVDQILVLGTGGMAKAVVSELYIKHPSMTVFVFDRKKNCMVFKGGKFQNVSHKLDKSLNTVIINCSSAGFYNDISIGKINKNVIETHSFFINQDGSNLSYINGCFETLHSFSKIAYIMDVIYQPSKTLLLLAAEYFGIPNQNGLEINLLQAAIGFQKVNPENSLEHVIKIMES